MANSGSASSKLPRRIGSAVLGLSVFGAAPAVHAANNCAWLNEATASGFLGGEAVGESTPAASGQSATCTFTQQDKRAARTLSITVESAASPHARVTSLAAACGTAATPLQAIGNEAVACPVVDRKGVRSELVVGRVREQVFTITIATSIKNDDILTDDALKTRIYTAAEQVAGNLF